jgi:hypothetical protein
MKKHRSTTKLSSEPITGIAEATAERVRLGGELLQHLAQAVGANERAQRRFRTAVLIRLSRIEMLAELIHAAQIVQGYKWEPSNKEKAEAYTKDADEFISQKTKERVLELVKFVYDEPEAHGGGRRRKRSP